MCVIIYVYMCDYIYIYMTIERDIYMGTCQIWSWMVGTCWQNASLIKSHDLEALFVSSSAPWIPMFCEKGETFWRRWKPQKEKDPLLIQQFATA